ncbi:hypothetical protein [Halorussus salinus]|uniref:hypothetical protein n=1 Tax=Halorussus salinus TaxID=1364935 RepID=UPI00109255C0|nr:hypothetical protein [Halorussus salinus]
MTVDGEDTRDETDQSTTSQTDREYEFRLDPTAEAEPEREETSGQSSQSVDIEAVLAQMEVLQEENRRLRTDYVRARQSRFRRAALALCLFSGVAGLGGLMFPAGRQTLLGLAGIGFVMAILIYYVTPQQEASASVGERSYATLARLEQEISADLGLQDTQIYVPTPPETEATRIAARLFVPLHQNYTVPDPDALTSVFIVETDEQTRGVSLPPTGSALVQEFRQSMVEELASTPRELTEQLTEALEAGFELVETAVVDLEADDGRVTVGVQGSTFGAVTRVDHPVPSFVATSLAVGLQTPVELAAVTADEAEFDAVVTCTWDSSAIEQPSESEASAGEDS